MSEKRDEFIKNLRKNNDEIDYSQVVFGYKEGILNPDFEKNVKENNEKTRENLPDKANLFFAKKVEAEYQRRKSEETR